MGIRRMLNDKEKARYPDVASLANRVAFPGPANT
jgi:hypothetical protein